ncbi:hypothetical protein FIE12Z_7178 [Fusarium flagelliforme]|uniref:Uncharacterized protein n=1 Tax=Fusarium flagelliforme TaxID=2675880 RepID=A0A395MKZ4_9HYPO|nr:hypothetical protein FIE12Z_7178 [Fusarium flagelliforme]
MRLLSLKLTAAENDMDRTDRKRDLSSNTAQSGTKQPSDATSAKRPSLNPSRRLEAYGHPAALPSYQCRILGTGVQHTLKPDPNATVDT